VPGPGVVVVRLPLLPLHLVGTVGVELATVVVAELLHLVDGAGVELSQTELLQALTGGHKATEWRGHAVLPAAGAGVVAAGILSICRFCRQGSGRSDSAGWAVGKGVGRPPRLPGLSGSGPGFCRFVDFVDRGPGVRTEHAGRSGQGVVEHPPPGFGSPPGCPAAGSFRRVCELFHGSSKGVMT